ncbi:hypothetical protein F8G81_16475 [Arthrobacter sp. CDRTa11]|uniref:hypothetical protein n=1 Tax=Arthrobacter sp. CDRTa11 TaxID=2651199 RepID=UPI002265ED82|nr:hypothetical protein [Arthrobacter sp. CDRTa11]UZX04019.1 hypothetical protein F8G81_16475 [Arthrobacter sp. CDRTa11]
MINNIFISRPHTYNMNVEDGRLASAGPAKLTSPTGVEPGVIIRRGSQINLVIPEHDAIRLANEIADALDELHHSAP